MPPHASSQQQHDDNFVHFLNDTNHDSTLVELPTATSKSIPPPPPLLEEQEEQEQEQEQQEQQEQQEEGVLGKMLNFNPCTAKIPNPGSALFKERRCAECGCRVYKYRNGGYEKEVVVVQQQQQQQEQPREELELFDDVILADDITIRSDNTFDSSGSTGCGERGTCDDSRHSQESATVTTTTTETKIYFMKSCYAKRQNRNAHRANGYGLVLTDLLDYHTKVAEDQRFAIEEEERDRLFKDELHAAEEEASREAAAALTAKRERSFRHRAKKVLKHAKMSFSLFSCLRESGVAEDATKVQPRHVQLSWGSTVEQTVGDSDSDDNDNDEPLPEQQPQHILFYRPL